MLGEYIKTQVSLAEKSESERRLKFLCNLPANTFQAIYNDCEPVWAGTLYNGIYYSEWEIYAASLTRDEGYEAFL